MRRRELITFLGSAAAWPLIARAQQSMKPPTIGYLISSTPAGAFPRTEAFMRRLRELGWVEGRNVTIEVRWMEGREDRATQITQEFVRLNVDIIVTSGLPAVLAAKRATSDIPIVFAVLADPVGTGVVASLSRPGGNVTGLSNQSHDLAGKRVELLQEIAPDLRRLAIIGNGSNADGSTDLRGAQAAAATLGLEVVTLDVRRSQEIVPAFDTIRGSARALYVVADPLINSNFARIHTLATGAHLATIYNNREHVEAGGLMSYGPDFLHLHSRAADYTDKILHGAKPADIPVEQPTKFELVINQTAAKAIAVTVPPSLLARADEVVE